MKIKICGLSKEKEVENCVNLGADFCGFILNYPKSHRNLSYETAKDLTQIKRNRTKYVGVLVQPKKIDLEKYSKINLDYFQLYGDYGEKELSNIKELYGKKIITVIQVKKKNDIEIYKKIEKNSDIILWDSSGLEKSLSWDYNWIKSVPKNITKMIAGNINITTLDKIFNLADIVDVSGALETNKVKDINKIKKFISRIKLINNEN
jgi:phosphoribosylanthranilate isomerase